MQVQDLNIVISSKAGECVLKFENKNNLKTWLNVIGEVIEDMQDEY